MSEVEDLKESQPEGNSKFKKEKRIDYQNTDIRMNEGQEIVSQKTTFRVYNPGNNIIEIDLGRDKSVRLDPYGEAEIANEFLNHPNLELLKGIVKIIN